MELKESTEDMQTNPTSQTVNPPAEEIAVLAYTIWEQEGCPHGRDFDHWVQAEAQLKAASQEPPPSSIKEAMTIVRAASSDKYPRAHQGKPRRDGRARRAELVAR
jgi:hypothetical protein